MNSILSIVLMAVGSLCAASFYVPVKKIRGWSWESYWLVQGLFSWLIMPVLFAWLTVPSFDLCNSIIGSHSSYTSHGSQRKTPNKENRLRSFANRLTD